MNKSEQICKRCVMDTSIQSINFDNDGICNYCKDYEKRIKNEILKEPKRSQKLENVLEQIKKDGKNKHYDCIIGVSGGVDSSYVAYLTKKLGLRALAVHLDNGWNSELAVQNIENLLEKLNIDLHTHVIDWEEFKDLQMSFIKSSIENLEIPTDHAISALLFKTAEKFKIKYIISGSNLATEGILPIQGGRNIDYTLIKSIHKKFGTKALKTYPSMSLLKFAYRLLIKKIKYITILNYIDFNKEEAMLFLEKNYNYKRYSGKHYESIFTRFYQGYILPNKYKYDKRKPHLSTLVMSGQLSREEALRELEKNPYPSEDLLQEDLEFFIKKFDLSREEFEHIMKQKPKEPTEYKSDERIIQKFTPFMQKIKEYAKGNI